MHCIDKYINNIEPRIESIIKNIPIQEEASLQSSLASYGWILLDAWISWRTIRYLLRDAQVDDQNQEKWIQTPSSYTSAQLCAAWNIKQETKDYIKRITDIKFNTLIDSIQQKRNSSAHISKIEGIQGSDSRDISLYFEQLSFVFRSYEIDSFYNRVKSYLAQKGYRDFQLYMDEKPITETKTNLDTYVKANSISFICNDGISAYEFISNHDGCQARKQNEKTQWKIVANEQVPLYSLWKNKGYYLGINLFCDTIIRCWNN